jgi:hypothetical protein
LVKTVDISRPVILIERDNFLPPLYCVVAVNPPREKIVANVVRHRLNFFLDNQRGIRILGFISDRFDIDRFIAGGERVDCGQLASGCA